MFQYKSKSYDDLSDAVFQAAKDTYQSENHSFIQKIMVKVIKNTIKLTVDKEVLFYEEIPNHILKKQFKYSGVMRMWKDDDVVGFVKSFQVENIEFLDDEESKLEVKNKLDQIEKDFKIRLVKARAAMLNSDFYDMGFFESFTQFSN